jgi:hypothetical protein
MTDFLYVDCSGRFCESGNGDSLSHGANDRLMAARLEDPTTEVGRGATDGIRMAAHPFDPTAAFRELPGDVLLASVLEAGESQTASRNLARSRLNSSQRPARWIGTARFRICS